MITVIFVMVQSFNKDIIINSLPIARMVLQVRFKQLAIKNGQDELVGKIITVSYTHLTLPTNREV